MEWNFEPELSLEDKEYDIAFIDRNLKDEEAEILSKIVRAHSLFIVDDVFMTNKMKYLMKSRCGRTIKRKELVPFFENRLKDYFGRPYGEKYEPHTFTPAPGFKGSVSWNGFSEIILEGDFGEKMSQAAFWRGNIPVDAGQGIDFWLEYKKDPGIEVELQIVQFAAGSVSSIQNIWKFSEKELNHEVTVEDMKKDGPVFASINAKGHGKLEIIALHDRYSRHGEGDFLPGSRREVTFNREEVFSYFDPGDMKPPLCVYFSGYKTMEGFEGYHMMRRMGVPFLLISESRLEGGAFYIGSHEYERKLVKLIEDAMNTLGFSSDQVILSGLSMGTFGAFYYGIDIRPAYIIAGKPLLSLGNMAKAERIIRPGGFPTSLDLLWKNYKGLTDNDVALLNQRFWDKFDNSDLTDRTFCIAYMIEDDYDANAYQELLSHVRARGAKVIGKGLHGRHNDDTSGIVNWFIRQYIRILNDRYDRKQD